MSRHPIGYFLVLAMIMCFIVMPAFSSLCQYLSELNNMPYTFHAVVRFFYRITAESASVPGLVVSFFIFLILMFNGAFNERN